MSKFKKKKDGGIPPISTASLPDIVFMLLFFFMVATVIKEDNLKIQNNLPQANQIEKLDKRKPISYIYIGKPSRNYVDTYGTEDRIQLNDALTSPDAVQSFIAAERNALPEELVPLLIVSLKVDRDAKMGALTDVKQELRKTNALKINYTTKKGDAVSTSRN
ncbi:biopolymer transporter ExbD [Lacinutrix sp. Hel_I_90]|uniref:ExbD/TolR family protein n=1 Tax=Lacinutrix sp. Hel_I_90 TaxID=1249999 RepID=UPI0005CAC225|nr:biopolymer transporter ExbD [Lacinutrix sp. Hel_I_90]